MPPLPSPAIPHQYSNRSSNAGNSLADLRHAVENFTLTNGNATSSKAIPSRARSQTSPRQPHHVDLRIDIDHTPLPRHSVEATDTVQSGRKPSNETSNPYIIQQSQKPSRSDKAKEVMGLSGSKSIQNANRKPTTGADGNIQALEKEYSDILSPTPQVVKFDESVQEKETTEEEDRVKEYARDIFNCTESLVAFSDASSWLMSTEEFNSKVRIAYMELFDLIGLDILTGVRRLCGRLYLKGETQQIDRLLEALGKRWYHCNIENGMKDPGTLRVSSI